MTYQIVSSRIKIIFIKIFNITEIRVWLYQGELAEQHNWERENVQPGNHHFYLIPRIDDYPLQMFVN